MYEESVWKTWDTWLETGELRSYIGGAVAVQETHCFDSDESKRIASIIQTLSMLINNLLTIDKWSVLTMDKWSVIHHSLTWCCYWSHLGNYVDVHHLPNKTERTFYVWEWELIKRSYDLIWSWRKSMKILKAN